MPILRIVFVNLPYGCGYWILFNWLPNVVGNFRFLCEQSAAAADPAAGCEYADAVGDGAESCWDPSVGAAAGSAGAALDWELRKEKAAAVLERSEVSTSARL